LKGFFEPASREKREIPMADLRIDPCELRPIVQAVLTEVLAELERGRKLLNGRLAVSEAEAADLLGLHSWQLRDLRLDGKISYSRIVGNRIRYTIDDLLGYLQQRHAAIRTSKASC
jgi:hypothetical protein